MADRQSAVSATGTSTAPWERRAGETAKAYAAFLSYRDAGPGRTLAQVAAARGCQLALVKRWSAKHEWRARARAWDAEQAREVERVRREQRRAEVEQQAEDAGLLRKLMRAFLKGLVRRDPETGELQLDPSIKPRDAVQFYRLAGDIDKSLPQPPEPEPDEGGEVLASLGTEELREMLAFARQQMRRGDDDGADGAGVGQARGVAAD
jgi:hypothetical protein